MASLDPNATHKLLQDFYLFFIIFLNGNFYKL